MIEMEKEHVREAQREVNWDQRIDNNGEIDNHHAQEEFGNEGKMITKTTGGKTNEVRYTGGAN